ncbi:MAG: DUF1593 domain-containing protein [Verrucomicrobiales bacterium]|nr:DUF1593 domain-containing protein [Verrucomicrobiales bacterium]
MTGIRTRAGGRGAAVLISFALWLAPYLPASAVPWPTAAPADVGLDAELLTVFSNHIGGHGCVVRHGRLVHSWGDPITPRDVASACKPIFTHFLLTALAEGLLPSLDQPLADWEPLLRDLNPEFQFKDRGIQWRHLIQQTSCYGLAEIPGTAFAYNDWQMALFVDTLFGKVYGASWAEVDRLVLHPRLTEPLGCEDHPTLIGFGPGDRPGRLKISPRDFARFGLLYLRQGQWGQERLLGSDLVRFATRTPLPATLPRASTNASSMIPAQRTLGSTRIPDNQTEHFGSYSHLWWINGLDSNHRRHWSNAPADTFAALGHGGIRALAVIPTLDLVVSWNDANVRTPIEENRALQLLCAAVRARSPDQGTSTPRHEAALHAAVPTPSWPPRVAPAKRRVIIETDAGGDPDDEQSLVRFLLYANAWDISGIIANRPHARNGENLNPARTGLDIVLRLLEAYESCWTNLVTHDPAYPDAKSLRSKVVAGYDDTNDGVQLLIAAADDSDPRPIWYSDWGSDRGSATNNFRRALDRVLRTRGHAAYKAFKTRFRLVTGDQFGPHTYEIAPAFSLWVDTWRPEVDGRRWYHRFSALTAQAGGFNLARDVLTGHGPLGALYPTNTTLPQKEGDSLSFLYLVPTGMDVPEAPGWGGWGGRLGPRAIPANGGNRSSSIPSAPDAPSHQRDRDDRFTERYFWANQADRWRNTVHRDHTLARWAEDLQNDFRARLDWCVQPRSKANHHPQALELCPTRVSLVPGESRRLSTSWEDPDGDALEFEWIYYPEAGSQQGTLQWSAKGPDLTISAADGLGPGAFHFILRVIDHGSPQLARYHRVVVGVDPSIADWSEPPPNLAGMTEGYDSLLRMKGGGSVDSADRWPIRRKEILEDWNRALGPWPPVLERAEIEILEAKPRENFTQILLRFPIAPQQTADGYLLIPTGDGPFPAVLVVFYDPETSVGLRKDRPNRDFALQLSRRGFVTLSLGTPGGDARRPDLAGAQCQPLAYHAYVAANAWRVLAQRPEVDAKRIGVLGHSYGGKWALFAGAFWEPFAAICVSDPGIVFDESRPNVNYWEPWYLGFDPSHERKAGVPTPQNPRTGAYAALIAEGRNLHEVQALIAPRPFLVSGGAEDPPERWKALNRVAEVYRLLGFRQHLGFTSRPGHDPTEASNSQILSFFDFHLRPPPVVPPLKD